VNLHGLYQGGPRYVLCFASTMLASLSLYTHSTVAIAFYSTLSLVLKSEEHLRAPKDMILTTTKIVFRVNAIPKAARARARALRQATVAVRCLVTTIVKILKKAKVLKKA
jgi:hypothetical protein